MDRSFYNEFSLSRKEYQDTINIFGKAALKRLEQKGNGKIRVLDIGCNNSTYIGWLKRYYPDASTYLLDIVKPLGSLDNFMIGDGCDLPIKTESFDLIICSEVIEHVFYTEKFISEIKRILKPEGLVILTTPNLSSCLNRILLLLGMQPIGTEVSEKNVYYSYRTKFLRNLMSGFSPVGHIKVFTFSALIDFVTENGFDVLETKAKVSFFVGRRFMIPIILLEKIFPNLARNVVFTLAKKHNFTRPCHYKETNLLYH